MTQRAWSILMGCLLIVGALLAGSGSAAAEPIPAGQQCRAVAGTAPAPIFVQTLHPECCTTISTTTTEATCDSVSYSADRCEQYNGGGQCAWTCHCCKPLSSQYSYAYCGQFDSLGAARCNAVWQGTACTWTC
jgi:hypothetical protein